MENKLIERIYVSRTEVLHFDWLNHSDMSVTCVDEINHTPLYRRTVKALIKSGIKNTYSEKGKITFDDHLYISFDKNEIVDVVIGVCDWALSDTVSPRDSTKDISAFYLSHKEIINQFFEELKKMLSEKNYKYSYKSVDGMN